MTKDFDADYYDSLDGSLAHAWRLLARATADRRSGFRTVQIATVAEDGPRVRTVVLRGAEAAERLVRVHTDTRAAKVGEIAANPIVEICAYNAQAKIQLRLRGKATAHRDDAVADAAWAATAPFSRVCYRAPIGPGAPIAEPGEADPTERERDPADVDHGRDAFVAVTVDVTRLEWLYLAAHGHRRAVWDWDGEGWRGRWLAP
jgi:pyridoxine/pyridoxamine 5'-phosphate oxidase